ncbi:MAG: hypothetical protein EPO10_27515 [Reyranella sp.]|uniref:hypothetical protein n=1 Tax=Reyranella sp. TaxID=1929291 RepID=UPI00121C32A6|nr:hypothetical protein [Reyranella sp.]TAJ97430.1 MAG: hypothetical protein EPO41_03225 [Reyranella sp.]TBR23038.1 MAG: hypothetical protein EPO10_27515 [Reyranella sp.]
MIARRGLMALGAAGVLGMAAAACTADVKTVSNVDAAYGRKLDRVLVTVDLGYRHSPGLVMTNEATYLKMGEVVDSLRAAFAPTGVTTEFVTEESAVPAATASFRPTQFLNIHVSSYSKDMGSPNAFTLKCEVRDAATQKRIWLSTITFEASQTAGTRLLRAASKKAADNFADNLVGRLRQDRLI